MNTRALLDELRALDVKLTADGGRLRINAPVGSITDQTKAALVENKPRLLEFLEWEQHRLKESGWKPKERCGKIIWQRPGNGFYYSQEMASHFLGREINDVRCKSGANERG